MNQKKTDATRAALALLDLHYESFYAAAKFAKETGHPVPSDTRGWSQILVSLLTGLHGLEQKKGADFADGSDVKAAVTWEKIDTPRFNGAIKAGTKAETSGKLTSLDQMPHLFFVLWDHSPSTKRPRCRVWCVRPSKDREFRKMCQTWYEQKDQGIIRSTNFQLHPPRGKDTDVFRNKCGNLIYPLLLCAERHDKGFKILQHHPQALDHGQCKPLPIS